uniref:Secreted protein n=1 Tax=Angiostrongylus cantonensis TaxID=6313 RepID=A0A0K0DF06_ANGCA
MGIVQLLVPPECFVRVGDDYISVPALLLLVGQRLSFKCVLLIGSSWARSSPQDFDCYTDSVIAPRGENTVRNVDDTVKSGERSLIGQVQQNDLVQNAVILTLRKLIFLSQTVTKHRHRDINRQSVNVTRKNSSEHLHLFGHRQLYCDEKVTSRGVT